MKSNTQLREEIKELQSLVKQQSAVIERQQKELARVLRRRGIAV